MIIEVDTELLHNISALSLSCRDKLEESSKIVDRVIEHDDWNCQERDLINDSIINTKTEMKRLMELFYSFSSKVEIASDGFISAVNSIPSLFQKLESVIGNSLSVSKQAPLASNINKKFNASVEKVKSSVQFDNMIQSYEYATMDDPISICEFGSFEIQERKL